MENPNLEDQIALSLFKAANSLMQSAIDHAASENGDPKQAEFFHRELEKKCRKLAPNLPTAKIPLADENTSVVQSPTTG